MTDPRDLIRRWERWPRMAWAPDVALAAALESVLVERDAALARVAALEDALAPFAEAQFTTGEMGGSVGIVIVHRVVHEEARAALAPLEPRTLETDLREDR